MADDCDQSHSPPRQFHLGETPRIGREVGEFSSLLASATRFQFLRASKRPRLRVTRAAIRQSQWQHVHFGKKTSFLTCPRPFVSRPGMGPKCRDLAEKPRLSCSCHAKGPLQSGRRHPPPKGTAGRL
jgi:hypothetical protein